MSLRSARLFALALVFLVGCDVARSGPRPADEGPVLEHSDGLLMEDFEDGDLRNAFDSEWTLYSDVDEGGGSRLDSTPWVVEGGYQSSHKARLDFTLEKRSYAYSPYLGIASEVPKDAAAYAGLSYTCTEGPRTWFSS
jgi:hypothetical protein